MVIDYFFRRLPRQLYRDRALLLSSTALFVLVLAVAFLLVQFKPASVYFIYGEFELAELTHSYNPEVILMQRQLNSNIWENALFYLSNNSLVGLQLFLAGVLPGIGTLVLLLYSAASLGMLMGYINLSGYSETMWPAIITHSSLELLSTIFAAVAGWVSGYCNVCVASAWWNLPAIFDRCCIFYCRPLFCSVLRPCSKLHGHIIRR